MKVRLQRRDIARLWLALRPGGAAAYALAGLIAIVTLAVTAALARFLPEPDFFLAYAAVAVAALLGGTGPGLLAGALCLLGFDATLLTDGRGLPTRGEVVRFAGQAASLAAVAWAAGWLRRRLFAADRDRARSDRATPSEAEHRFPAAVNRFPGVLVIYDRERRIELVNAIGGQSGIRQSAVQGRRDEEIFPEEVTREYLPALDRALATGSAQRVECALPLGGPGTWVVDYVPLLGPAGDIRQVLGIGQNITEQRRAEEERDDLVRALSHDVRTPLNVVTSHAQLLLRGAREESPAARRGVAILAGARRIAAMVDDLVLAGQIEGGRFRLVRRPLDLAALAAESIEHLRGAHPVGRVRVEAGGGAPLSPVEGDAERLKRALQGLLLALLGASAEGEVRVGLAAEGGRAVLTVSSAEAILPEADLPHLFERAFRARAAPDTFDGLGLDLYLARRIAEAHGGSVGVESASGRGTTFTFAFGEGVRG